MNEIEKLKTEHARYKKALKQLSEETFTSSYVPRIAQEALNPPPPPPVTLPDLQDALYKAETRTGDYVSLLINKDGSGNFRLGCSERRGGEFNNLYDALAMLLSDTNLS